MGFALAGNQYAFAADIIEFKSGKIIEGEIVKRTDRVVEIFMGEQVPTGYYIVDDIKSINGEYVSLTQPKFKQKPLSEKFLDFHTPGD